MIYRGFSITQEENYPTDKRYIHSWSENANCLFMSLYYPLIEDLTIETFFADTLDKKAEQQIQSKNWEKAFIKRDIKALEHIEEVKSVYPQTSLEEISRLYEENNMFGTYAIRKFIDPEIIDTEERYWVLNHNIYHRNNTIPAVVSEAVKRLAVFGAKYYTIDATPDFIIEVNPGESSDRHAVNSAELFASWFKKEFGNPSK